MDGDSMANKTDQEALSFEQALERLESIVHRLETGDAGLDDSITLYSEGVALRQLCEAKLKAAEARIEKLQIGGDGMPVGSTAFGDDPS
jgi:exodeoxyribonuclease VII small subunit